MKLNLLHEDYNIISGNRVEDLANRFEIMSNRKADLSRRMSHAIERGERDNIESQIRDLEMKIKNTAIEALDELEKYPDEDQLKIVKRIDANVIKRMGYKSGKLKQPKFSPRPKKPQKDEDLPYVLW